MDYLSFLLTNHIIPKMFYKTQNITLEVFYERFTYCPCGKIPVTIRQSVRNKKKKSYLENY